MNLFSTEELKILNVLVSPKKKFSWIIFLHIHQMILQSYHFIFTLYFNVRQVHIMLKLYILCHNLMLQTQSLECAYSFSHIYRYIIFALLHSLPGVLFISLFYVCVCSWCTVQISQGLFPGSAKWWHLIRHPHHLSWGRWKPVHPGVLWHEHRWRWMDRKLLANRDKI